ncbi:MAG: ABC transporter ATP-binding protein [Dehalococcoidia bacterium]|nr:ABC transporter ATP-binding protein [Dehalococcoidia bacterium]
MEPDYILEVETLTKDFGGLRAVNELSFGIRHQEILGLIGPNGSGKTTTINLLSGVYKPSVGQILFGNTPIQRLPPWKIAMMGISRTFQQTQFFVSATTLESVVYGCHMHERSGIIDSQLFRVKVNKELKASQTKAMGILETLGLTEYAARPAASLPPGAQRILAIAMCLAGNPKLLFLDEPVCGLSAEESNKVVGVIRKLRDQGLTVLVIDHDMRVMMNICDRLVVIDHGTKIAEGVPREIQANEQVIEAYLGRRRGAQENVNCA